MAKLIGPLMSLAAQGSVGGSLTYSERRSGSQVRFQRKQGDRITPGRTTQRGFFIMAFGWWHELTTDEQNEWDAIARYDC